jgi:hypothetical protein
VYVESGDKKVFASAVDWPGWSRGGKTEEAALQALVDYAERYRTTLGTASRGMPRPEFVDDLDIVERLKGNASTDFGIPALPCAADDEELDDKDLRRQVRVLQAAWEAFDRIATDAAGEELQKGPRGGGRDVDKIATHVREADGGYLPRLGALYKAPAGADEATISAGQREAILKAIAVRSRGEPPPKPPRKNLWTIPYYIRRSAWHALDHAWEIEDKRL